MRRILSTWVMVWCCVAVGATLDTRVGFAQLRPAPVAQQLGDAGAGLTEVSRIELPLTFDWHYDADSVGGTGFATLVPNDFGFFTLDLAHPGAITTTPTQIPPVDVAVSQSDGHRRFLVTPSPNWYWWWPHRVQIYDADDPSHLALAAEAESCGGSVLTAHDDFPIALSWGSSCARLIHVDTGEASPSFSRNVWQAAIGGGGDSATIAIVNGSGYLAVGRVDRAGEFVDPLHTLDVPPLTHGLMLSRDGGRIFAFYADRVEVRDVATAALLGQLALPESRIAALAEGGGAEILAVSTPGQLALWDLADPAQITLRATLPIELWHTAQGYLSVWDGKPLVAGWSQPWLAVLGPDRVIHLVDVAAGVELAQRPMVDLPWVGLIDDESTPPVLGIVAHRTFAFDGRERWRQSVSVESFDLSGGALLPLGRVVRTAPSHANALTPFQGRYAWVADLDAGSIGVVDTASGSCIDAVEVDWPTEYSPRFYEQPTVSAEGRRYVVLNSRHAGVFEFDGRKVAYVRRIDWPPELGYPIDVALLPDGSVAALVGTWESTRLVISQPDGTLTKLDLPYLAAHLERSADRRRLLADPHAYDQPVGAGPTLLDVADPRAPRIVWSGPEGAAFANFVRGDAAVAVTVTGTYYSQYAPQIFSADTGAPLGAPGPLSNAFYYYRPDLAYGTGTDARLVYWHWTWSGWQTTVYDVSQQTPALLATSPEYFQQSFFAARGTQDSYYQVVDGDLVLGKGDGTFEPWGKTALYDIQPLRYGFVLGGAGDESEYSHTLVIARDATLNRGPTAVIDGPAALECAAPSGTPADFDGSASSDPDSSPGTSDDLAAWDWLVDGQPAQPVTTATQTSDAAVDTLLALGSHAIDLAVRDRLGAVGRTSRVATVSDTTPPAVGVTLEPLLRDGVFARQWIPQAVVTDRCDPAVAPTSEIVLLPAGALVVSPVFEYAASDAMALDLTVRRWSVTLRGTDRTHLFAVWEAARGRGGLLARDASPLAITTAQRAPKGLAQALRFALDADGFTTAADARGAGADVVLEERAVDTSGNGAVARTSYRTTVSQLCQSAPQAVVCLSGP